jgi:hypothetical protein
MHAFRLWEIEGRPMDAHERHWLNAIREVDAEDAALLSDSTASPSEERSFPGIDSIKPGRRPLGFRRHG